MVTNDYLLMELVKQRHAQLADSMAAARAGKHTRRLQTRAWRRRNRTTPTSPFDAARAGAGPDLRMPEGPVTELRVHRDCGSNGPTMLQHPGVVQPAGDSITHFYRRWTPGGSATRAVRLALLAALTALVVAACTTTSAKSQQTATATASSPSPTATPTTSAAATTTVTDSPATVAVPAQTQLKSALLTQADVGPPFRVDTSADGGTGRFGGCTELANLINDTSTDPGEVQVEANFTAGDSGPFFTQSLVAEPMSSFGGSFKASKRAIASCTHLTITDSGVTLSFDLTPFNFVEGATGKRLDGEYQGVTLNGYLAIQRISSNVAMLFFYFQIGSGSPQLAYSIYSTAVDKAKRAFPSS